jgi:ribosomal protein S18 acetylase RimI-like enzyme
MALELTRADFALDAHCQALGKLLEAYALDPMGGGQPLSAFAKAHLPQELARRPFAHGILAFVDQDPAGLAVCFEGFSTFACQPLLNIHDLIVAPPYRGRGIAKRLLQEAEHLAVALGCCKLTLEVLEGNHRAQSVYRAFGFDNFMLDPAMGRALFLEKKLLHSEPWDAAV